VIDLYIAQLEEKSYKQKWLTSVEKRNTKGLITWRISARAEMSAWLAGLKFQPGF